MSTIIILMYTYKENTYSIVQLAKLCMYKEMTTENEICIF